jgi:carbon-monoxide dehydrogenase medium subunit
MRSAPFIRGIFHPSRFAVAIYGEDFNDTVAERQYRLRFKPVLRIMKAAPFAYSRPATVDEACALLSADENARVIAGGQSLVPMMAMRLARPTRLVDIARIASLSYVREDKDGITIGACTRQAAIERDKTIASRVPLLARAMPLIGHAATRARGTIGGSLVHADPAAELPLIAVTLDATLNYRQAGKDHDIAARAFFKGLMMTALPNGACLIGVRFPVWPGKLGTGFHEVNARRSDFAFVAAAAQLELDAAGKCRRIAICVGAATEVPIRLDSAEKELTGGPLDGKKVVDAVRAALSDIEPLDDLHATAAYRRRAAVTLAARAIADAKSEAMADANAH